MENISKEITETVNKLAALIQADPRYGALMEAQQAALAQACKGEEDAQLAESIRRRLGELYSQVVEHPVYLAYKEASDAYHAFYQAVSQELELALNGGQSGCTHDCSTCSGCH